VSIFVRSAVIVLITYQFTPPRDFLNGNSRLVAIKILSQLR
jgi:hypothetical protein